MNFKAIEMNDGDEFDFTATYGTAVFLVRAEKTAAKAFGDHRSAKLGHGFEHGDYQLKHPKAA